MKGENADMNAIIDNYQVSSNGRYIKVCIDGQNIIHEKSKAKTKEELVCEAMGLIKEYNERHNLKFGEYDK